MTDHPGIYLKRTMKIFGLTPRDMYRKSSTCREGWVEFLKGRQDLTEDMAYEISERLNIPADFWLDMQNLHDKERTV